MSIGPAYLLEMRGALTKLHHDAGQFIQGYGSVPVVGSQAENEKTTFARPQSIVTAWSLGTQLIEFGGEHVTAFVKTVTEPIEVIACWTCVRSMLESCALSAWLLDPLIDARTRVGRVFAHRYEGLKQQLKFGRFIGRSAAEISAEENRIDAVEQDVLNLGYPRVLDRNGKRIGFCQQMPSTTDMIDTVLNEGKNYRMLSAIAHGHHWAINGLCYKPVVGDTDFGGVPAKVFEKTDNLTGIVLLGLCAMKALARPLWNQCHYFGWDSLRLEESLEKVADILQAAPAVRFWRS
jgi:hypothetical protein